MRNVITFWWQIIARLARLAWGQTHPIPEQTPAEQGVVQAGRGAPIGHALGTRPTNAVGVAAHHALDHYDQLPAGWSKPKPEKIPQPTYWPALFGFGIMFVAWGLISNFYLFGLGIIIWIIAFAGWVYDLRNEFPE